MELGDLIIKDADFPARLEDTILPFIKENIHDGYCKATDGGKLHYQYLKNPQEKAAIFISHGYCEFITKFYEIMYYFYNMDYSVYIVEHRGHGYSDRMVKGYSKVHIDHFETYVTDFDCFVDHVKRHHPSDHYYLFAHSMGGAVAALYLEGYPATIEKAVLSSPMIEMSTGDSSKFVVGAMCALSYLPGFGKMYVPGHKDYNGEYKYPKCSSISENRYRYQFDEREKDEHYRTNGASLTWTRESLNVSKKILKNANLVKIPVILMQASEDHLVNPQGQNDFAKLSGNTKLIRFEGAKHEIFNATDEIVLDYYKTIREFFS